MFTLLHTNDFHNHLTPHQAEILRRLRSAVGAHGLIVDAGDAVASGNITFRPWGETILKTMNHIGYDAMTVGNREFHVSRLGFHCKVGLAQFPILCANVRASGNSDEGLNVASSEQTPVYQVTVPTAPAGNAENGNKEKRYDPFVCSHIVRTLQAENGRTLKILLFGLTVPMVTERMAARHASAYLFDQPIATAQKWVPHWKEAHQPDVMIALTHIGYPQDRKLAEAVPGIDLIIGGHSHTRLPNGEQVGNSLIVQTGCFGHQVGRINILQGRTEGIWELSAELLDLPKIASEADMEAMESQFRASSKYDSAPGMETTVI